MRVAFITQEYPPHIVGGAGAYAHGLVSSLCELGIDVTVFTVAGADVGSPTCVPVSEASSGALSFWRRLPKALLQTVWMQGEFDVIHGNGIADLSVMRHHMQAARIVTVHHVTRCLVRPGITGLLARCRDIRGETGLVPLVEGHVMRRADRVIADTEMTRTEAISWCRVKETCVETVHIGVRIPGPVSSVAVSDIRSELCLKGERLVLAVGRLEYRKGVDILIRAWARLAPGQVPYRLVLAGDGDAAAYQTLAQSLGVSDYVSFLGRVDPCQIEALYDACDLFVLPSRNEGFGLVAVEAMSHGKPVIMTHTGVAMDGIVGPENGAVVPAADVEGLASAISRLLENPAELAVIGERNRESITTRLSWKTTAAATIEVYKHAMADRTLSAGRRKWSPEGRARAIWR
ncbi:MAG: glycosyltransferase family 4 protein [Chloroflexota bacterium]